MWVFIRKVESPLEAAGRKFSRGRGREPPRCRRRRVLSWPNAESTLEAESRGPVRDRKPRAPSRPTEDRRPRAPSRPQAESPLDAACREFPRCRRKPKAYGFRVWKWRKPRAPSRPKAESPLEAEGRELSRGRMPKAVVGLGRNGMFYVLGF